MLNFVVNNRRTDGYPQECNKLYFMLPGCWPGMAGGD